MLRRGGGFIGGIISTVIGLAALYFIWSFIYDNFEAARPVMDNMLTAVNDFYQWAVSEWGGATVGGAIVLLIILLLINRR